MAVRTARCAFCTSIIALFIAILALVALNEALVHCSFEILPSMAASLLLASWIAIAVPIFPAASAAPAKASKSFVGLRYASKPVMMALVLSVAASMSAL